MTKSSIRTFTAEILICGDFGDAKRVCRRDCNDVGLCVTIIPSEYVYTGGAESGIIVRLIHYPRFGAKQGAILDKARALAELLRKELGQDSYCVLHKSYTDWVSYRDEHR